MMITRTKPLTPELEALKEEIRGYAVSYGLDFYEVIFEICDYETVNILAALGGFPTRYPHWRFGMDYDRFSKGYAYGVQKIYEMVINTDPCYAYLLKANHWVDQKIVMAHVYGHADFFKHNAWFSATDRKMMNTMANHRTKIRRYMEQYGQDEVESFIDKALSLENLIDVREIFENAETRRKREELERLARDEMTLNDSEECSPALRSFIKSNERMARKNRERDSERVTEREAEKREEPQDQNLKFPKEPQVDIMKFLSEHAPIDPWQSDIIGILRDEAYYFLPQRMTKIMNEGWASYWHSTIMTKHALAPAEIVDFADHHSGVMQMSRKQLNPYKLGIELFRDIKYRWDTGRFGKEYNECPSLDDKAKWDLNLMMGDKKIFDVRRTHNDITFIDEYLTPEFCDRNQIFTYKYNPRTQRYEIDSRDFKAIKLKLLTTLTNFGSPFIQIEDANFNNRGELLLTHRHYGVDLDAGYAQDTMKNIFAIWKRPVNLATSYDENKVLFSYDGKEFKNRNL